MGVMRQRLAPCLAAIALILVAVPAAALALAPPVVADAQGVAILGYDPVAYFTEGRAVAGSAAHEHRWNARSGALLRRKRSPASPPHPRPMPRATAAGAPGRPARTGSRPAIRGSGGSSRGGSISTAANGRSATGKPTSRPISPAPMPTGHVSSPRDRDRIGVIARGSFKGQWRVKFREFRAARRLRPRSRPAPRFHTDFAYFTVAIRRVLGPQR